MSLIHRSPQHEKIVVFRLAKHPAGIGQALFIDAIGFSLGNVGSKAIYARAVARVRHGAGQLLVFRGQRNEVARVRLIVGREKKPLCKTNAVSGQL